jgi:hypothetical protein
VRKGEHLEVLLKLQLPLHALAGCCQAVADALAKRGGDSCSGSRLAAWALLLLRRRRLLRWWVLLLLPPLLDLLPLPLPVAMVVHRAQAGRVAVWQQVHQLPVGG